MEKYKQTVKFTSAASALMLLLNHFNNRYKINKKNEFKLWVQTVALPTRGSCVFAIASIAYKKGIKTRVVVGDKDYKFPNYKFKGYTKKEVYAAKYAYKMYYEKAKKEGLKIEERDFDLEEVKELIKEGKIVLLRINVGPILNIKPTSNYILVYKYGNEKFLINDTMTGSIRKVKELEMKYYFETVKSKCKRDNGMIIFG